MARTKKSPNTVSDYFRGDEQFGHSEIFVREAFLRMAKDTFDGMGVESWTVEQVRGALMLLEKFAEIKDEL